jgi:hypothetical protein
MRRQRELIRPFLRQAPVRFLAQHACALVALFLGAGLRPAQADTWTSSELTRFTARLSHPISFRRLTAAWEEPGFQGSVSAANMDTITDGTMSVALRGEPGWTREGFDGQWKKELRARGQDISYKVKRDSWYVVSGVEPDGSEFYTKAWLLPSGGFVFHAVYPHSANAKYDPILERMLKGFKPAMDERGSGVGNGPVGSGRIDEKRAERIVAEKLGFKPAKRRFLLFDHVEERGGREYLVLHGYDLVIDDPTEGTGHTATWGWYYVDAQSGEAFEWDLAADQLRPIKPLRLQ